MDPQGTTDNPSILDDPFADLFPAGTADTPTTAPGEPAPPETPAPQAPATPAEFLLQTKTGSVYKSRDEAIRGIETKDQTIEMLRQRIAAREGVDPLTGKPVAAAPQAPVSYLQEPDRYLQDLQVAATRGDKRAYLEAQMRLIQDAMSPYLPVVVQAGKSQALNSLPEPVRNFVSSPDFESVLKDYPTLASAIDSASQSPQLVQSLPELYRLAFSSYQSRGMAAAGSAPNPAPRTSTPPGTLAPPSTPATPPQMGTTEGRKAIIQRALESGLVNTSM